MGNVTLKCYNCGSDVLVSEGSHVGICSFCTAEIPVPQQMDNGAADLSRANRLLSESRFEEARELYREVLIRTPFESAACWGFAVSQYGIEFVQDPHTAQLLPTLHRLSTQRFSEYLYVKKAIEYAPDFEIRQFYLDQSALIDQIQSRSLDISRQEEPYDVFICYKKTEADEKRTADSRMAADLYKELVRRGYKTFFAETTLKVGEEYEPRIFAALNSARVLLAIGSKEEYYEAVWVKNEWSRYADLIRTEEEQGGTGRLLIPVYYNLSHDRLPETLRAMPQSVDLSGHSSARQMLFSLIADHFAGGSREDTSDLRRQVRGQLSGAPRMETSAENYLARGTVELVNRSFETAEEMFCQANEIQPSVEACLGLMMCARGIAGREALHQYDEDIREDDWFRQALELADGEKKAELETIARTCLDNRQWSRTCAAKQRDCEGEAQAILRGADGFTLDTPACKAGSRMQKLVGEAKGYLRTLNGESDLSIATRMFIYWGNLFPAASLFLNEWLHTVGFDPDIEWVIIPGTLAMLAFYVTFSAQLLGKLPFLESGCLAVVIRLGVGFAAAMLLVQAMNGTDITTQYLLVSLVAAVLYYLIRGRRRGKLKKRVKDSRKQAGEMLRQVRTMEASYLRETLDAVQGATAGYRDYYRADDWAAFQTRWEQAVRERCAARLEHLRDDLALIQSGKAEKDHA